MSKKGKVLMAMSGGIDSTVMYKEPRALSNLYAYENGVNVRFYEEVIDNLRFEIYDL